MFLGVFLFDSCVVHVLVHLFIEWNSTPENCIWQLLPQFLKSSSSHRSFHVSLFLLHCCVRWCFVVNYWGFHCRFKYLCKVSQTICCVFILDEQSYLFFSGRPTWQDRILREISALFPILASRARHFCSVMLSFVSRSRDQHKRMAARKLQFVSAYGTRAPFSISESFQ